MKAAPKDAPKAAPSSGAQGGAVQVDPGLTARSVVRLTRLH